MNKEVLRILENKKVKATAVRELVLEVFLNNRFAHSLSDIEDKLPWSDRVSIYRTLKTFEEKGVIHQINDGSGSSKYGLCEHKCQATKHLDIHPHFHCNKCGKTICLEKQEINIQNIPDELRIVDYSLILNGLCSGCKDCN